MPLLSVTADETYGIPPISRGEHDLQMITNRDLIQRELILRIMRKEPGLPAAPPDLYMIGRVRSPEMVVYNTCVISYVE